MVLKILVSSGNVAILELVMALERLFLYKRNSSGPKMDLYGSPGDTGLDIAPRVVVC